MNYSIVGIRIRVGLQILRIWSWSLGFIFLSSMISTAACSAMPEPNSDRLQTSFDSQIQYADSRQTVDHQQAFQDLTNADVVYLGETHASPEDHDAQLEIIQELHRRNPRLAIGLEMFQRPFQPILDAYLAGDISADELRQQSEYDQRWGFPWSYYAPILEFAQAQNIPVLALNVPTEITRTVAQSGLEGLDESDLQWIPPASDIRTDNRLYQQMLSAIFHQSHHGHGNSDNVENFFLAQVLWDETMAERIADYWLTHPKTQLVVLAGQGHLVYGYGIPSRVERRLRGVDGFSQRSLLLNPGSAADAPVDENGTPIADYFWINQ
ncbi:MAG: ChaN family lipoprotein [Elainellaceae cyanobacterium]